MSPVTIGTDRIGIRLVPGYDGDISEADLIVTKSPQRLGQRVTITVEWEDE